MAVCIRLKRDGRKHLPFYHICVFNSRQRRDGRPIEELGFYDPASNADEKIRIDVERVKYWISEGAKPSDTVASMLRKEGLNAGMWNGTTKNKKRVKTEGAAQRKLEQKKSRAVKARKKPRSKKVVAKAS